VVIVPVLIGGWYAVRGRVLVMAKERVGITGNYPVYAETPLMDELLGKEAVAAAKKAAAEKEASGPQE
jgi:L-asparagine permease